MGNAKTEADAGRIRFCRMWRTCREADVVVAPVTSPSEGRSTQVPHLS